MTNKVVVEDLRRRLAELSAKWREQSAADLKTNEHLSKKPIYDWRQWVELRSSRVYQDCANDLDALLASEARLTATTEVLKAAQFKASELWNELENCREGANCKLVEASTRIKELEEIIQKAYQQYLISSGRAI